MALYGAAMVAVQHLEFCISFLHLVGNYDPEKASGSAERQLRKALARLWESLNRGTAPMKLADAKKGIAGHLDEQTAAQLKRFLDGPRNRLAHRFLIQALPALGNGGVATMAPYVIELIEATKAASALSEKIWAKAMELVEELPEVEPPPPGVQERLGKLATAVALTDLGPESFLRERDSRNRGATRPEGPEASTT
jgi:hypothetical protein